MAQRLIFTRDRLLAEWKLRQGLAPLISGAVVTRTDGIDLNAIMMAQIDAWYQQCLLSMDPDSLPLTDIAPQLTVAMSPDGSAAVILPPECLRVTGVMMRGWCREAYIAEPDSPEAEAQKSAYARGGCTSPVAVIRNRTMHLYTPPADDATLLHVTAVMMPDTDVYHLTPQMLAAMPIAVASLS